MNTLHTFGCSYTAYFESSGKLDQYMKYKEYRGGNYPKIWPELLSEKLNLNLNNTARGGASNYEIFQIFCDNVKKFRKGDVVVVGWSHRERFRLVNQLDGTFRGIGPHFTIPLSHVTDNTINEILDNRSHVKWADEIHSWEKVIYRLCNSLKIKVVIWSFDYILYKSINLDYDLREIGAETIFTETGGKVEDNVHYGEQGHKVQCDYFLQLLNNKSEYEKIN